MKKIIMALIFGGLINFGNAQDINAPEPDFVGQIVHVSEDNAIQDLEMQVASYRQGASVGRMITGAGKVKGMIVAKGNHSPVEVKKANKIYFIYNHGNNEIIPTKVAQLLKFEAQKKTREYMLVNASNITGQTTTGELNLIPFKGKKYGNNSYLIEVSDLEPGEYAFSLGEKESLEVHLFSIVE